MWQITIPGGTISHQNVRGAFSICASMDIRIRNGDSSRRARRRHAHVALRLQLRGGCLLVIWDGTRYAVDDITCYAVRGPQFGLGRGTRGSTVTRYTRCTVKLLLPEPLVF